MIRCICCDMPVSKSHNEFIHVWYGSHAVLESGVDKLDESGDTGLYPIGPECLKSRPELQKYVRTITTP